MGAILRFIVLSLVFTFLLNSVFRLIRWFFGAKVVRKEREHIRQQYRQGYRREGDVTIHTMPKNQVTSSKSGDYADFEEIK
jgi:hypothetical protein